MTIKSYNEPPFESDNNNDVFSAGTGGRRVRAPYRLPKRSYKKVTLPSSAAEAKDVPQGLKDIFTTETFLQPRYEPGIYVIYFPQTQSVYIGQSQKIKHEIALIKTPRNLSNRPLLKFHFDRSGKENVKAYALLQGPEFEDRKVRTREEYQFIKKAGPAAVNIAGNTQKNPSKRFTSNPDVIDPLFKQRKTPWQDTQEKAVGKPPIHYSLLPEKPTESCIYIFRHKKMGHFYIGQSETCIIIRRMNKHRSLMRKSQYWELQGVKTAESDSYGRMIEDMKNVENLFEYGIIEYCGQLSKADRKKREDNIIAEAFYKYGNRVYNKSNKQIEKRLAQYRLFGRLLNTPASSQPLLAYYERDPKKVTQYKNLNYPVIVEGNYFDSFSQAGKALSVNIKTVTNRCRSSAFPNYIYVKEPKNKIIPNTPEVQIKLQLFNKLLTIYNIKSKKVI